MPTHLMLLWHMHQPFYKDLAEDEYAMPWVRLHALKDYFGMVAMLEGFPKFHCTVNLVPSLVVQLRDYAEDRAREEPYRIAFERADRLTPADREKLLTFAFQVNRDNLLNRYPRFRELHDKVRRMAERAAAARVFSHQEVLDLQVLSQLAWFDEIYLDGDAETRRLAAKGRGYTEEDKSALRAKELELFKAVLEVHKKAVARGQIEISTSPFYHPILPLLCDTEVAAESHPGVRLPRRRFVHPEDAREQLRSARDVVERTFGVRPRGLWPSEGSVSDEVLKLASEEGFEWAATDEGVLGRSLQTGFYRQADGSVTSGEELYRPHRFESEGRGISLFFRDHQLSDLIGFVYSRMDPRAAAEDLHRRVRAAGRSTGIRPAVVSVILDGENAWEFFPRNGREFLKAFYGLVSNDPDLRALTATEALAVTEPGKLTHIVPGSWINANFDIWIGADEDNRAWDLLHDARDFFAARSQTPGLDPAQVELARQELWIAEGSDWCWWYGPEHSSAHDEEFDLLYRKHLSNIYRLLDASPPDELAVPIKRPKARAVAVAPTGWIEAAVDGRVTNYFEWLGAGVYVPDYRSGSMHGSAEFVEALYYGFGRQAIFLRLDFRPAFLSAHPEFEVRVNLDGKERARLNATVEQGKLASVQFARGGQTPETPQAPPEKLRVAFGRILEAGIDLGLTGFQSGDTVRLQVSLWVNELPAQVIPPDGWLSFELAGNFSVW